MINKFKNRKAKFYDLKDSIGILCNWLYNTFKKKIILLIDNYDLLILDSLNTDFFDDIYSFYQNLLTNIFQKKKKKKKKKDIYLNHSLLVKLMFNFLNILIQIITQKQTINLINILV